LHLWQGGFRSTSGKLGLYARVWSAREKQKKPEHACLARLQGRPSACQTHPIPSVRKVFDRSPRTSTGCPLVRHAQACLRMAQTRPFIVLLTKTGPRCISFRCKVTVSLAQGAVDDAEADVADPVFVRSTIDRASVLFDVDPGRVGGCCSAESSTVQSILDDGPPLRHELHLPALLSQPV